MHKYTPGACTLLLAAGLILGGCARIETASSRNPETEQRQAVSSGDAGTTTTDGDDAESRTDSMDDAIDIDGTVLKGGATQLDGGIAKITAGGTYELRGSAQMVVVDAKGQDVTLVMDTLTLENASGPGLYVKKAETVHIQLAGDSTITCGNAFDYEALNAALYSKADLEISGDGTLSVTTGYGHGIKANDSAQFDCSLDIDALQDGIHVNDTAVFAGGSYEIQADSEGIESKDVLEIRDGLFSVHAVDDALNALNSLTVSGGKLTLVSQTNDAVDSNGTLEITGGDIQAVAVHSPETVFDVDNTPFVISGGTIAAIGTNGVYPTETDQPLLLAAASSAGSVRVEKDGKTILDADLSAGSADTGMAMGPGGGSLVLFLSCPEMKTGDTVTVFVDDALLGEVTLEAGTTTLGIVPTMGGAGAAGQQGPGRVMEGFPGDTPSEDRRSDSSLQPMR